MTVDLPLTISVEGVPAAGGSKSAFCAKRRDSSLVIQGQRISHNRVYGRPVVSIVDAAGKGNKLWRKQVVKVAKAIMKGHAALDCLLVAEYTFYVSRPKNHYVASDPSRELKDRAPVAPGVRPDVLKLTRSTEDALTDAGVWADDALVVSQAATKLYATLHNRTGCEIMVDLWRPEKTWGLF